MDDHYQFRGRCPHTGKWWIGHRSTSRECYHSPDKLCIVHDKGSEKANPWRTVFVDPSTIGQCTGLSAAESCRGDKPEDLLVFDGDILHAGDWGTDWIVFWNHKAAGWFCKNTNESDEMEPLVKVIEADAFIYGTIHDTECEC